MTVERRGDHFVIVHAGRDVDFSFATEGEAWKWADANIDDQVFDTPNCFSPPLNYRQTPQAS
ncbi:hypothetical protein MPL3356_60537 [Mesorhizobium plurifarium]|uniref:Uncharacterized protein n=1 Tax=Mesorhizobium plurifarium TaxID=69974 RepID=A0A090EFN1_MESPL|nr:hypothetical protein MPL3356_60537 [Mesorhizobium plurifarium]